MKRYLAMLFLACSLLSFLEKGNADSPIKEGQWATLPINEHIKELNWLIGEWKQQNGDLILQTKAEKVLNENFILMNFTLYLGDKMQLEGKQVIGWNPLEKQIFSWIFDSDGGYGQGKWKKQGNSWIIESVYTFANGSTGSSINTYTLKSEDNIIWESSGKKIDGKVFPNVGPINIKRIKN